MRSRKSDRWTTLGPILQVKVFGNLEETDDIHITAFQEACGGRHESAVAVAGVEWNSDILEWFEWSEDHAST